MKTDLEKVVANLLTVPKAYVTISQMKEGKIRQTRSDDFTMMATIAYRNKNEMTSLEKRIKSSKFRKDFNNEVSRIESLKDVTLATIDIIGNEYMLTLSSLEGGFLLTIF